MGPLRQELQTTTRERDATGSPPSQTDAARSRMPWARNGINRVPRYGRPHQGLKVYSSPDVKDGGHTYFDDIVLRFGV